MDALIKSQMHLIDQMDKFVKNVKKTALAKRTHGYYVGRLEGWQELWKTFSATHYSILDLYTDNDDDLYFKNEVYESQELSFYEFKGELNDLIKKLSEGDGSKSEKLHEESSNKTSNKFKLPPINIQSFKGDDFSKWLAFRDMFLSVIDSNTSLDNIQKLHYLHTYTAGEANDIISGYNFTSTSYTAAWAALRKRFDNKRLLINAQLKILFSQSHFGVESSQNIKKIIDTTTRCIDELRACQINVEHWDIILIFLVSQRLPSDTIELWEQSIASKVGEDLPTFKELLNFLETRFRTLEMVSSSKSSNQSKEKKTSNEKQPQVNVVQSYHIQSSVTCPMCKNSHQLRLCSQFKNLLVKDRDKIVKQNSLCSNCLSASHTIKKCSNKHRCFICNRKHHTMLHFDTFQKSNQNSTAINTLDGNNVSSPSTSKASPEAYTHRANDNVAQASIMSPNAQEFRTTSHFAQEHLNVLLATAVVNLQCSNGEIIPIRALIDSGSQSSFITAATVQRAGLQKLPTNATITGVGQTETARSHSMVKVFVASRLSHVKVLETNAVVLRKLTDLLPSKPISTVSWLKTEQLDLADPNYNFPNQINMILGADLYPQLICDGVRKNEQGNMIAQNTIFGWIVSGPALFAENRFQTQVSTQVYFNKIDQDDIIKKFWELEEIPNISTLSPEEKICEDFYEKTVQRNAEGRYIVRLPFKNENGPNLGRSRIIAEKRAINLENRLNKNEKLKRDYVKCLFEYLELKQMIKIDPPVAKYEPNCFIPHHAVIKESSLTTKLRIVFDASCPTSNKISLNQELHTGPRLQQDISAILIRWRLHQFVFCSDIEKMYRQILVSPQDTKYQRIIWKNDNNDFEFYELLTVTFGTACAPYLAIKTLLKLAKDEELKFPLGSKIIRQDMYVDDVIAGFDTIEEAVEAQEQIFQLLKAGGFLLKKWAANHSKLLENIPKADKIFEFVPDKQADDSIKTLGVLWSPTNDILQFKINLRSNVTTPTKRNVISTVFKIYDPQGFSAPVIFRYKTFIRTLWQAGLDWDQELPLNLKRIWEEIRSTLPELAKIKITRWIGYSKLQSVDFELHGFSDASEKGYGAVVYSRITLPNGIIITQLLMAKTKVAPIHTISLPRLELCGALLVSKLLEFVKSSLFVNVNKIFAWTDSQIVLAWIRGCPSRWKTFVSNRVSQILNVIGPTPWNYIPSQENPADCCSRGLNPNELINHHLWWKGPPWLSEACNKWPIQTNLQKLETDLEMRNIKGFTTVITVMKGQDMITRFSSLRKLKRITILCLRFIKKCSSAARISKVWDKSIVTTSINPYQKYEYSLALQIWVVNTQEYYFQDEFLALKSQNKLSNKSSLLTLNPFLDDMAILRVGGRLDNANLPYSQRHPIILPHHATLAKLIISDAHEQTLHGGLKLTLSYIRQRYWILKAKNFVKLAIQKCVICARFKQQTKTQIMGSLPSCRINMNFPFLNVGVDYAGPIYVRPSKIRGRGTQTLKGYIVIFICMMTKAIHIELASDLTTETFLAAFRRFTSRRGLCQNIYSDCGSNFQGAANILQNEFQNFLGKNPEIFSTLAEHNIRWHFLPPAASHMAGLWESGVKSIKYHLRRIVGNKILTYEEFYTFFVQIEACLNSRPICPITCDPNDLDILTPAHFLIGRSLLAPVEAEIGKDQSNYLKRWNLIQKLKQDVWKSWKSEFLGRLQQRQKWLSPETNLKIGDLVLIKDERLSSLNWPRGRVIAVHPGKDNMVRVVTLITQNGELKRPIHKLCLLPIEPHLNDTLNSTLN